ncbi:hypothetical protein HMPREF7545_1717 [Selenomonas noxia ATCC 43541]|uniref:hypothetical protein n=1 Tax=Selenomonas noxia TaxID=135083 RepID=UPI0001BCECFF|nr:hypothetical protein [Selenomonas noxia]EFF65346.1 hypothetical protein HMPREF7545_1717 [Selenomonas noxia ATCC 43541]DAK31968.1 MAG TPA: Invasion protein B family [Caudoviricetes sp.]
MFIVKDLERLREYGFKPLGYKNSKGLEIYQKEIGVSKYDGAIATLELIVNAQGARENEVMICCDADFVSSLDDTRAVMWDFEEISEMLNDDVIVWSKLPRP